MTYSSQEFSFDSISGKTRSQNLVKQYPPGKTIEVYFNPNDPTVAVLRPGTSWFSVYFIFSGLFLGFGLLSGVGVLREKDFITEFARRQIFLVFGSVLSFGLSYAGIVSLNNICLDLSTKQCSYLWGTTIISALATILLVEILIARKTAKDNTDEQKENVLNYGGSEPFSNTFSRAIFISVSRIILVSILGTLPVVFTGGFISLLAGVAMGFSFEALGRGVLRWLPAFQGEKLPKEVTSPNNVEFNSLVADTFSNRSIPAPISNSFYLRADEYYNQRMYEKAIDDYSKAIEFNYSPLGLPYYNRGRAYQALGKYKQAMSDYIKSTELNSEFPLPYFGKATLHHFQGEIDKAILNYEKYLERETNPSWRKVAEEELKKLRSQRTRS